MAGIIEVRPPYPGRKAAKILAEQVVASLLKHRPKVGELITTDADLSRESGLSPATVRRALADLQRQGWIDRRVGLGTFVGQRVAMPVPVTPVSRTGRKLVRLGVLTRRGEYRWLWLDTLIFAGIESAAADEALGVELLSDTEDSAMMGRRIGQSRPDVLASIMPRWEKFDLLSHVRLSGIPWMIVGMRLPELKVPNVCEDGLQGVGLAVQHLASHGHRRIALVNAQWPYWWVFDRRRGYMQALAEAGLPCDERLVFWDDLRQEKVQRTVELRGFLEAQKPTAVLFSASHLSQTLAPLIQEGRISVPRDMSVVVFDQDPSSEQLLGIPPTHIELPLIEMGRLIGRMARQMGEGLTVESTVLLPCRLIAGGSVQRPTANT